jgi:anthranilate synthase component I
MIYPNKKEYLNKAKKFNLIPVYEEFIADTETPVSIFIKAGGLEKESFLLESIEGAKSMARYSFIGIGCDRKIVFDDGDFSILHKNKRCYFAKTRYPLDEIQKVMSGYRICRSPDIEHFIGGAVGYLGYDNVEYFDDIKMRRRNNDFPQIMLFITDCLIVFDHMRGRIKIISTIKIGDDVKGEDAYSRSVLKIERIKKKIFGSKKKLEAVFPNNVLDLRDNGPKTKAHMRSNFTKEGYIKAVEKVKKHIINGDVFQLVLSQRFTTEYDKDPFNIYRALRTLNPSPYMFFINFS